MRGGSSMNYFIVDDDPAVRKILTNLIENELGGEVIGEAEDGSEVYPDFLNRHKIDILAIDLLMPVRDGIETLKALYPDFTGKSIMLSQVETKQMIAEAYMSHAEAYITKPINKLEVVSVFQRIERMIQLEHSIRQIQQSILPFSANDSTVTKMTPHATHRKPEQLLTELGIRYEKGAGDITLIVEQLMKNPPDVFPPLKVLWNIESDHWDITNDSITKQSKAMEQRVRRAIQQSFNHIASLGAMDMTHPKFDEYGMEFFDLDQLHIRINEIRKRKIPVEKGTSQRINVKRFLQTFYDHCRQSS
jgi:two-component system, response regulator YcbB